MINKWIFSFDNVLTQSQTDELKSGVTEILRGWETHGLPLEGNFEIFFAQVLVIGVEQASEKPSGCSIDSLKRDVLALTEKLGLKLFDSNLVLYQTELGFSGVKRSGIKSLYESKAIDENTLIIDVNDVLSRESLDLSLVKVKDTWVSNYLN